MAPTPPKETAFPGLAPRVPSEFRASLLQLPLFGDEKFIFTVTNISPTVTATATVQGRLWSDADREIRYFSQSVIIAPNGAAGANVILERGAILTFRITCQTAGIALGDVFATAGLFKGVDVSVTGVGQILQGYVGPTNQLSWPGSPVQTSLDGPGVVRMIAWTQVAPTLVRATVPASRRWRVITGTAAGVADATVGARGVFLVVTSGGVNVFFSETALLQPPGSTVQYALAAGISRETLAPNLATLVPWVGDLELRGGDVLELALAGPGGPADTLTGARLNVREWLDP